MMDKGRRRSVRRCLHCAQIEGEWHRTAREVAVGQNGGSYETGARLIARAGRLCGGEETKRCKNDHVPAGVVNGAMMIHHE